MLGSAGDGETMEGAEGGEAAPAGQAGVPGAGGTRAARPAHSLQAISRRTMDIVKERRSEECSRGSDLTTGLHTPRPSCAGRGGC